MVEEEVEEEEEAGGVERKREQQEILWEKIVRSREQPREGLGGGVAGAGQPPT